jgi:hypothetical protein
LFICSGGLSFALARNNVTEFQEILKSPEISESVENLLFTCVVGGKVEFVKVLIEKANVRVKVLFNLKPKLKVFKDEFERSLLHVCHPNCLDFLLQHTFKTGDLVALATMEDTHKCVTTNNYNIHFHKKTSSSYFF